MIIRNQEFLSIEKQIKGIIEKVKETKPVKKPEMIKRKSETSSSSAGKNIVPKLRVYFRLDAVNLSVGEISSNNFYLPVFLGEMGNFKAMIQASKDAISLFSIKTTFKMLTAISPHTMTSSTIVRSPIRLKVSCRGKNC